MDCKSADEANGDIGWQSKNMRKSGAIKAAKKQWQRLLTAYQKPKSTATSLSFWKLTARLTSWLKMLASVHFTTVLTPPLLAKNHRRRSPESAKFEEELQGSGHENRREHQYSVASLEGDVLLLPARCYHVLACRCAALTKSWLNSWRCTRQASRNSCQFRNTRPLMVEKRVPCTAGHRDAVRYERNRRENG